MDYANAFHMGAKHQGSFVHQNSGKDKVMDLFARVDQLNAASDEEDSDVEFNMMDKDGRDDDGLKAGGVSDGAEEHLMVGLDLNYDIRGKDSRPELFKSVDRSFESDSNIQFDQRNLDSEDSFEAHEREHLSMLKRDSNLLDDRHIQELQAAQSILDSCGLGSSNTPQHQDGHVQHNFRPSGMSLGFADDLASEGLNDS